MPDCARRIALVTGSSRGIGYGIARGLLNAGFDVVLHGCDRDRLADSRSRLDAEHAEMSGAGGVHAASFDIGDPPSVYEAVDRIEDEIGPIAVLVNNAGVVTRTPLLDLTITEWRETLAINATGAFVVGSCVARRMVERKRGKIVNVGSVQSNSVRRGLGAYAAAKGALTSLTRAMCVEWGPYNIQVNALAPGYVRTDMNTALVRDADFTGWLTDRTPAGRWGTVDDVVGPAVFLCSDQSDFVSGQVVIVDGGLTAGI